MSRKIWRFTPALGLVIWLAACSQQPPQAPASSFNNPAVAYPTGLQEAAQKCCPNLHLPQQSEVQGAWADSDGEGSVAFLVEGDFNGDGLKDAATLLVAASSAGVELGVFEGNGQGYRVAHRRILDRVGNVVITAPQEIVLRLVRKGEEWAPEGGDVPQDYAHAHDAIVFETRKVDSAGSSIQYQHLVYWDGKKYAEY